MKPGCCSQLLHLSARPRMLSQAVCVPTVAQLVMETKGKYCFRTHGEDGGKQSEKTTLQVGLLTCECHQSSLRSVSTCRRMLVPPEAPAPGLPFPAVSTAALGASKCEGLRFEASPPNPVLPCVGGILLFQGP